MSIKYGYFVVSVIMTLLISCSHSLEIEVGILWKDDPHIDLDIEGVQVAIMEGEYTEPWALPDGLPAVLACHRGGAQTHYVSLQDEGQQQMTAVLYLDLDENSEYTDGYDQVIALSTNRRSEGKFSFHLPGYF